MAEHKECVICGRDTVAKCSKCGKDVCLEHIYQRKRYEPLLCKECYIEIYGDEVDS